MLDRDLTPVAVERLIAVTDPWLSCDECFEQADAAVEAAILDEIPFSTAFRTHVKACAVCLEEAATLAVLVAAEHGRSEEQAIASLESAVAGRLRSA